MLLLKATELLIIEDYGTGRVGGQQSGQQPAGRITSSRSISLALLHPAMLSSLRTRADIHRQFQGFGTRGPLLTRRRCAKQGTTRWPLAPAASAHPAEALVQVATTVKATGKIDPQNPVKNQAEFRILNSAGSKRVGCFPPVRGPWFWSPNRSSSLRHPSLLPQPFPSSPPVQACLCWRSSCCCQ